MPGTPATSPRRGLPRPGLVDTPDVPRDLNAAIDALDLIMAGMSTGPGFPASGMKDGDFRFNTSDTTMAATGSLYKWDATNSVWNPCFPATSGTPSWRIPTANSVDSSKIIDGTVQVADLTTDAQRYLGGVSVSRGFVSGCAVGYASATTVTVAPGTMVDKGSPLTGPRKVSVVSISASVTIALPTAGNHQLFAIYQNLANATPDGPTLTVANAVSVSYGASAALASAPGMPAYTGELLALGYATNAGVNGSPGAGAPWWVAGAPGGILDMRCGEEIGYGKVRETGTPALTNASPVVFGSTTPGLDAAQGAVGSLVVGATRFLYAKRSGAFSVKQHTICTASPPASNAFTATLSRVPATGNVSGAVILADVFSASRSTDVSTDFLFTAGDAFVCSLYNSNATGMTMSANVSYLTAVENI